MTKIEIDTQTFQTETAQRYPVLQSLMKSEMIWIEFVHTMFMYMD